MASHDMQKDTHSVPEVAREWKSQDKELTKSAGILAPAEKGLRTCPPGADSTPC